MRMCVDVPFIIWRLGSGLPHRHQSTAGDRSSTCDPGSPRRCVPLIQIGVIDLARTQERLL
jgi:hypothetical protein